MRDNRLEALRETYINVISKPIVESRGNARSEPQLLSESKRQFPHLKESQILENRRILDNINFFKVTVKEVQAAYPGTTFAEARRFQKLASQFAIMEYHSRAEIGEDEYLKSVNESSKVILELEPFTGEDSIDPNSPEAKKWAQMMAATKGKGPEDTVGPKMDMSSGEEAPEPKKKKGFLGKAWDSVKGAMSIKSLKNFIKSVGEYAVATLKSKETYKALAIGAVFAILGAIPGAAPLVLAAKGGLSLWATFKGSKGLLKAGQEMSGGKKGMDGVKEFLKNAKDPKAAAKILGQVAQIALGAWGASSVAGDVLKQIKVTAAENMYNPAGGAEMKAAPDAPAPAAPAAPAPEAPAAPEAPVVAPSNPVEMMDKMRGLVGKNYEKYLENPEKYNSEILGYLEKMGVNPDSPASEVFKGMRGNMSVRDYVETTLDGLAKSKQMAAMAR
jgi:hypothetical protein